MHLLGQIDEAHIAKWSHTSLYSPFYSHEYNQILEVSSNLRCHGGGLTQHTDLIYQLQKLENETDSGGRPTSCLTDGIEVLPEVMEYRPGRV